MRLNSLVVAGAAAFGCADARPVHGLYFNLGGGIDFLQDQIVEPYEGYGPAKRSYTFDPGAAVSLSGGYGLGNGLRLEIEGDYSNNHVSGVQSQFAERSGGVEQQYGGFANALYDFDIHFPILPYVGGGIGYRALELDNVNSSRPRARVRPTGSESEGVFAYQAIAGLSYPIGSVPGLTLFTAYRFVGVTTPPPFDRGSGSGNVVFFNGVRQESRATFNNTFNHEILVGFRYAFDRSPPAPVPRGSRSP